MLHLLSWWFSNAWHSFTLWLPHWPVFAASQSDFALLLLLLSWLIERHATLLHWLSSLLRCDYCPTIRLCHRRPACLCFLMIYAGLQLSSNYWVAVPLLVCYIVYALHRLSWCSIYCLVENNRASLLSHWTPQNRSIISQVFRTLKQLEYNNTLS